MYDLQKISKWFDDLISMDASARAYTLESIPDRRLVAELKSLLEADTAATRAGFLSAPAH